MIRVSLLGASGYGGAELIRRLSRHPEVEVIALGSRAFAGQPLEACWPHLAGLSRARFVAPEEALTAGDVLFTATPHGATAPLVAQAQAAGRRVVDLSADFRLPPSEYEVWYGQAHPHPELYDEARYGLVELHREEITGASLVANPGCNASAAILALAPLAAAGALGEDVVANIMTGVSGAGRGPGVPFHLPEAAESVKPYKVAGEHRHTAEIELTLGRTKVMGKRVATHADADRVAVTFNPHLVPMIRGILATCSTRPTRDDFTTEEALVLYREFYSGDPMVHVQKELPQTKSVSGSDRTIVTVRVDPRTGMLVAFAALDNLGKGAAGQAVQNFNVMHGLPETLGLELEGRWP
ncbi:MAG: N-acetyl-gamma-glutamyl-phosphate reductase [Trueperaceae bacterium]